MKRMNWVHALFGFLRTKRDVLFDENFQDELQGMYRDTRAGEQPHPPAMMYMVLILQGYVGASDAEAVELAVMDLRWQMVLNCLGAVEPPFSQGALQAFRERLVANGVGRASLANWGLFGPRRGRARRIGGIIPEIENFCEST